MPPWSIGVPARFETMFLRSIQRRHRPRDTRPMLVEYVFHSAFTQQHCIVSEGTFMATDAVRARTQLRIEALCMYC